MKDEVCLYLVIYDCLGASCFLLSPLGFNQVLSYTHSLALHLIIIYIYPQEHAYNMHENDFVMYLFSSNALFVDFAIQNKIV